VRAWNSKLLPELKLRDFFALKLDHALNGYGFQTCRIPSNKDAGFSPLGSLPPLPLVERHQLAFLEQMQFDPSLKRQSIDRQPILPKT